MTNVFALPGTDAEHNEKVVSMLKEWLERAENGEMTALFIVSVNKDNDVTSQYYGHQPFSLIGGVESLKHDMMHGVVKGRNY